MHRKKKRDPSIYSRNIADDKSLQEASFLRKHVSKFTCFFLCLCDVLRWSCVCALTKYQKGFFVNFQRDRKYILGAKAFIRILDEAAHGGELTAQFSGQSTGIKREAGDTTV